MKKITFPLKARMRGLEVANLREGLGTLLVKDLLGIESAEIRALGVKLKAERSFGQTTVALVRIFQKANRLEATGEVNEKTAQALNKALATFIEPDPERPREENPREEERPNFVVAGTVLFADESPAEGLKIAAFERILRKEKSLGQANTDAKGNYNISYSPSQSFKNKRAGLVVKALGAGGDILATSDIMFKAPRKATIDLTITADVKEAPSLFEKIARDVSTSLGNIKIENLEEDGKVQDLTFLAGETGFEKELLARFVLAYRLAQNKLPTEFWFVLLAGSFYQYAPDQSLKDQAEAILNTFPSLDAAAVRKALARGFKQNEIAKTFQKNTKAWTLAFIDFSAAQSVASRAAPTLVKTALEEAGISGAKKQQKFARLFNQHKALTPKLIKILEKDPSFKKAEIDDLKTSFQLSDLTEGNFSAVKVLKKEFGIQKPQQIRLLAKKGVDEWVALAKSKAASGELTIPFKVDETVGSEKFPSAEIYGKMLERQFREKFPTAAFSGGLERALQNGGVKGLNHADDLGKFLGGHETFDLLRTSVDDFLDNNVRPGFKTMAKEPSFRQAFKSVQRVFKLAPTFEATETLLADDLHSAQKIYRVGKSNFIRRYSNQPGFTKKTARLAWERAAETHAAVLTVVSDLKAMEAEALPAALQNGSAALSNFPNWNNLFKAGDICECDHCRSVLGPAAYFLDLLMYLKDRDAKPAGKKAIDILLNRRPDLGFLELNCDNALTPLPYIDVVCEVLEDVVADGDYDLELAGFTVMPADPDTAKTEILSAFQAQNITLDPDFSLSQVDSSDPDRWVTHGPDITYLLKKKTTANFFAEILRNTKASADELRAYPQYVNPEAYKKLRASKYPFGLPFDLFAEEVRAAFKKTKLQRWDLMQTLRGNNIPNNPNDSDIAAEYFGISADPNSGFDEKRLILTPATGVGEQKIIWGETGASWLNNIKVVKTFLQKTNLEYGELLELIDLKFIDPDGDININHLDPSCDLDQKTIEVLTAPKLDRIHRFLRLWRKLDGWKMWELDLVICNPAIGDKSLDDSFLVNLFYFDQIKNKLGTKATVEHVGALFDKLNTRTYFTKLHEKRGDALYQNLFLNKRLIRPPDPKFFLDPDTEDLMAGETITASSTVILAALGISQDDLNVFKDLTKASDGTPFITDDLTLSNLSFIWRHDWLSGLLKFKPEEWKIVLETIGQDVLAFSDPQTAWDFLETVDHLKATGFDPDDLNWLLNAEGDSDAAVKEEDAVRFLATLRKDLQAIREEFDPGQYDFLTPATYEVESLAGLLTALLQKLNRDEAETQFFISTLKDEILMETKVSGLAPGPVFPQNIPIQYHEPTTTLRFSGVMTNADKAKLLTDPIPAITGNPSYQAAINDLYNRPRLALKFFDPVFKAPLVTLPAAIDFKALSDPALVLKISYDYEQKLLCFAGILSNDDKAALEALSADGAYLGAVNFLATQPGFIPQADDRVWVGDGDLQFPLRDLTTPANDHLAENLAFAITDALQYLSKTLSEGTAVQQISAQINHTEALTRHLLTQYQILPKADPQTETFLIHLLDTFATTSGVVDYNTLNATFEGWYWLNRVATILEKWKITLEDLKKIDDLKADANLLDISDLPLDNTQPGPAFDLFLRTNRLLRFRDSLPETSITLFEVLEKLKAGSYGTSADFAADVEALNENWPKDDVETLTNLLDLTYSQDYLLVESWERLRRAFNFLGNLNTGANTVKDFAAPAMTETHTKTLKELLRSKFGTETWLTISGEIQDSLREQKRDALAAYLLAQPMPVDAPTGKWENTNDLYAYYLLDIEMSSCQLTSRLVQGSGSIQLFVQRCFMGLERDIEVIAGGDSGDSAWHWWKWMRKYRVWEANRKVFLWPENWIEPELKKDRSSFFKDLENELQQNEINQDNVEKSFISYLEKLDNVAHLEVAGFYQEDDGDNTIVHVFGRNSGVEPHEYFYRRYDYRHWTPWEKVDLDIQGDHLIPAVVNKRLYLFWPVFTEVPDQEGNKNMKIPNAGQNDFEPDKPSKILRMQLAVSYYRQGKWTPKKVSTDYLESYPYRGEIIKDGYRLVPIDRSEIDGIFGIQVSGWTSWGKSRTFAYLSGTFEIAGCKGVPELTTALKGNYGPAFFPEYESVLWKLTNQKWKESSARLDQPENDFTLEYYPFSVPNYPANNEVLEETPWIFKMTPPWQLSYMDKLLVSGKEAFGPQSFRESNYFNHPVGSWLPYFYNDKKRTFFVLPTVGKAPPINGSDAPDTPRLYYPEFKSLVRQAENVFKGHVEHWTRGLDLSSMTQAERDRLGLLLQQRLGGESSPPYNEDQLKNMLIRWLMRIIDLIIGQQSLLLFRSSQFHFKNFYHAFVCDFAKLVYNPLKGIPALMSRETQFLNSGFSFKQIYKPFPAVIEPGTEEFYPEEIVDFSPDGAYSPYNWELFFHAPLLVANALNKNQRFEEAREWYHFMFNPIGVESPFPGGSQMSKYWITKPFYETTDPQYTQQRIENILRMLAGDTSTPEYSELKAQVIDWRTNPFEPHRIANYRTIAYQKTVVMKYLDNLIDWGDYLFRQDSMESTNEAAQLYILAAEILGPRPKKVPHQNKPPLESFNEFETNDPFSNALVEVENLIPMQPGTGLDDENSPPLPMLYFCIPQNEIMLEYWDTISDRLYKIRHCMNIEGVVRQLALFEPPIDPAALVKAVAGGVDISSALADLNAPLPLYRFNVMLQKANEVCGDVKALGGALLGALEKKDAEELAQLRQGHEIRLLESVKIVREKQIEEAKEALDGVKKSKELAKIKKKFYESRDYMNVGETVAISLNTASALLDIPVSVGYITAGVLQLIPAFLMGASGFGGSPHVTLKTGGDAFGPSAQFVAQGLSHIAGNLGKIAAISNTMGGYARRKDDWDFQKDLAVKEIEQIEEQIAGAELRIAITEQELKNHERQIENAKETDEFMRSKYTNKELYQWQVGQISGIYFQSYKLAYDLAKQAERAFRFELGLEDSNHIKFGYWDSLKKGLHCGDKLQYDLRRLETSHLEKNKREFELTKHISLALLNPLALVQLKETGRCFISLPEEIFDLDYPGHYFRRIKSVSITLPCVVGPYTTLPCTLRLLKNSIRKDTTKGVDNNYSRNVDGDGFPTNDIRFIENNIPVKAIAASNAQNDSGVFELNFRDERYLPFEGAGVISDWSLELFNEDSTDFGRSLRQFDFDTISDAILHIKFTAREDAGPFKSDAISHLKDFYKEDGTTPSFRMFSLRHEFPDEWERFLNPVDQATTGNVFKLEMSHDLFRILDKDELLKVNSITLLAKCTDSGDYTINLDPPLAAGTDTFTMATTSEYGGLHYHTKNTTNPKIEIDPDQAPIEWSLKMTKPAGVNIQNIAVEVEDILLILGYEWD